MKIALAGIGYVGLSNEMSLAQHYKVMAVHIVTEKVKTLNNRQLLTLKFLTFSSIKHLILQRL